MAELAEIVKWWRKSMNLTLHGFGEIVSIPPSTLSKVENGKLSLSYEKVAQIAAALDMNMSELLSVHQEQKDGAQSVTARRSVSSPQNTIELESSRYGYEFLCSDILNSKMVPIRISVKKRSPDDFGELLRHSGEEFLYVLTGSILLLTEFYSPVELKAGQSAYIDSSAGHGYVSTSEQDAELMIVCTEVSAFSSESMANDGDRLKPIGE